jgi:hypothetical protein
LLRQGWDIKDQYRNTSRDNMPDGETLTTYADRLFALAELNIAAHGGTRLAVNGRSIYRIRIEAPSNVEPLPDLKRQSAAMRSRLRIEVEKGIRNDAGDREKASALTA